MKYITKAKVLSFIRHPSKPNFDFSGRSLKIG